MTRGDGRSHNQIRNNKITRNFTKHAEGSVLIETGDTKIICNATVEEKVPPFLKGSGLGWVTAEYAMLPRATETRNIRESARGRISGRSYEIQRLIGRSLRGIIDFKALGERTIWVDCDVIQADGGTRTAAVTGGFIAIADAVNNVYRKNQDMRVFPIKDYLSAISVGVVDGRVILDLTYSEDSKAEVDMNIVMTGSGDYIEIQGTAESAPLKPGQLFEMLELAGKGTRELIELQKDVLCEIAQLIKK